MSPKLFRELHKAPKPAEVSYGVFENDALKRKIRPKKHKEEVLKMRLGSWGKKLQVQRSHPKAKHVYDLLQKRPEPRMAAKPRLIIPNGISELRCMDAKSCRVYALTKRMRGLPIFCPLDEPEPFEDKAIEDWDFVYVKAPSAAFPYTGERWYAAEVAEYMLDNKLLCPGYCKAGLRASKHIDPKLLGQHFETIKAIWHLAFEHYPNPPANIDGIAKQAILSVIGLWNMTEQHP